MKFDYISDLHIDFHMNPTSTPSKRLLQKFGEDFFSQQGSSTLLIAGDIGHYPEQNRIVLEYLKSLYDNVLVVFGNHDRYRVSKSQVAKFQDHRTKIEYQRSLYEKTGIVVLDGDSIEIDGVTFGGASSWYDGSYFYQTQSGWGYGTTDVETYWKSVMNDSRLIGIDSFYPLFKEEIEKIQRLQGKVDVMTTHVRPTTIQRFFDPKYQYDRTNAFYSFEYSESISDDPRLKAWVFGHSHERAEYDFFGKKLLINALGYKSEVKEGRLRGEYFGVKSYEI